MLFAGRLQRCVERRPAIIPAMALAVVSAVSTVRYQLFHVTELEWAVVVSAGSLSSVVATITGIVASRRAMPVTLVLSLTAIITVLVIAAPSAAWCVVPLVVVLQTTAALLPATVASGLAVVAAALSVPRLTGAEDPGLFVGCLLAGFVFLGAVALSRAALTARSQMLRELIAARKQLVATERRASALAERQHVAAELHDTVVQPVAGALFLAEAADRSDNAALMGEARSALRTAVAESRSLVDRLDADAIDDVPLVEGLMSAADRVGATVAITGTPRELAPLRALTLLRAAQSALGNAERHALATAIRLELRFRVGHVEVEVVDDGAGFDVDAAFEPDAEGGHGLMIMRRRLAAVGGALEIRSDDSGTAVRATIPTAEL